MIFSKRNGSPKQKITLSNIALNGVEQILGLAELGPAQNSWDQRATIKG